MMAYITLEDDTASIEMLAFSNAISQYGSILRENEPVVVIGKFSVRDDKEPQIVVNRARPMEDFAQEAVEEEEEEEEEVSPPVIQTGTLYLRLPDERQPLFGKIKAILNMFPGDNSVVLYFADTGNRRGGKCALYQTMLQELKAVLGEENVVLK